MKIPRLRAGVNTKFPICKTSNGSENVINQDSKKFLRIKIRIIKRHIKKEIWDYHINDINKPMCMSNKNNNRM